MVLGRKGQKALVGMMIGVIIFIMAMVLTEPLKENVKNAINTTTLNSSNPNLGVEAKAAVLVLDLGLFYFISVLVAVSIAVVTGKKTIVGILIGIFLFMVIVILITPLKDLVIMGRDADHLDCGSSGISVGARLTCIFVDLWLFYFVVMVIASAITIGGLKFIKTE